MRDKLDTRVSKDFEKFNNKNLYAIKLKGKSNVDIQFLLKKNILTKRNNSVTCSRQEIVNATYW